MSDHRKAVNLITRGLIAMFVLSFLAALAPYATAGDLERRQAKRIHDRIAGVPPSNTVLDGMEADIVAGNPLDAADTAMTNPAFYNVTLKNFAAPWTNRDQSVFVPLNDYTATVIGMIRDSDTVPFDQLLYGDIIYTAGTALPIPNYDNNSNAHYQALEDGGYDLSTVLSREVQSVVTGLPANATAGVMTTRGAAEAYFVAGTNRAMLRFTLMNHLCSDLEQLKDTTRAADRIRQDISRSPGGDSRLFLNSCVGCHSGMDPLAQAFAYYNFNGTSIEFTDGVVQPKYHINATTFPQGFVTPDDAWDNYWRAGQNALLGWDAGLPGSGNGAKSLGMELARSNAFASCQVKKVFRTVCLREPGDAADRSAVDNITASFISSNYNMKTVFAETAVYCMGN